MAEEEGIPPEVEPEAAALPEQSRTHYLYTRGHPIDEERGNSYEYVSPEQEALYTKGVNALAAAKGTYKVAVQCREGMFSGTDADVYLTLIDEAGAKSAEFWLSGELQEGVGPAGGPDTRVSSQGKIKGRWWNDKDDSFEAGTVDYFFLETGLTLGPIAKVQVRVDDSKQKKYSDWDLQWVGVTFLAIGGDVATAAERPTKMWSFPCAGVAGSAEQYPFFKTGKDSPAAILLDRDEDPADPSRPLTEMDEQSVAAFFKLLPNMRTGDQLFFLAPSWTAPWTTSVTGQPYSHAGTIVVDTSTGSPVCLAYEATDNHSGTPDFCMGAEHRAMEHLGMWGMEVVRRIISHHGNVLYSPLIAPEGQTEEEVWEKTCGIESSNYAPGDIEALDIVASPTLIKNHLTGIGFSLKHVETKEEAIALPVLKDDYVMPAPLARNPRMNRAMMQFSKHVHMNSAAYDKWQFATATVKALTSKVNLSDSIVGIDGFFAIYI